MWCDCWRLERQNKKLRLNSYFYIWNLAYCVEMPRICNWERIWKVKILFYDWERKRLPKLTSWGETHRMQIIWCHCLPYGFLFTARNSMKQLEKTLKWFENNTKVYMWERERAQLLYLWKYDGINCNHIFLLSIYCDDDNYIGVVAVVRLCC